VARGILLDIEGTTTPIHFVYEVLFPYARAHAKDHLDITALHALKVEHEADLAAGLQPPPWSSGALAYVYWLMDHDRKSTALKALQGRIWQDGYRSGELHGEVFADVPPALKRWQAEGVDIRIYSSGSVLAQKLIFSTTSHGDLTRFLNGFFDTTTGPKTDSTSYKIIAQAFGLPEGGILFVSDVVRELDAASAAGLEVCAAVRPGNPPQPVHQHRTISTFEEI
jgi:enolase-phosphatase E1